MGKKINSEAGLTLVEMLAATVVLTLLALMLNTGLQMTLSTYQTMIAQSEMQVLLSTAVDTIADDLRYARDVVPQGDFKTEDNVRIYEEFTYTSGSFGRVTGFGTDRNGQIVADVEGGGSLRVLSTGAYGKAAAYKAYKVDTLKVILHDPEDSDEVTFTIALTVTDGSISASTPGEGVTVRCLNRG